MSETEIALARAYLDAAGQDPVGALIRSVRDLARTRRLLAGRADRQAGDTDPRREAPLLRGRPQA